jgi:hypothetical protein
VFFDSRNELLDLCAQRNRLGAKNQLVQILPMVRLNSQTGAHVLIDEDVVEHHEICECAVPCVVVEDRWRRAATTVKNDMGRMLSSKTPSFSDRQGITRGQRPQHSREGRFSSTVLRVDEGEPREGDVRRAAYGIELANVPEEL